MKSLSNYSSQRVIRYTIVGTADILSMPRTEILTRLDTILKEKEYKHIVYIEIERGRDISVGVLDET